MKALLRQQGKIRVQDVPEPHPNQGEALIKVLKAGICNTDLEIVKGYMDFEGILGHEFVGEVKQAPSNDWLGKRVVGEINIACGRCDFCRQGLENHCPSRSVLGINNKNGAFAEYLTLPLNNLHEVPEIIDDQEVVFVEPLAAALRILEQVRTDEKDGVLILGDGKLGLLAAQVIKSQTDRVACSGKHQRKLDILKNKEIKTFCGGESIEGQFDIVVEATGSKEGLKQALSLVKPRGRVVLKSTFCEDVDLDVSSIVIDEVEIIGSRCGPFSEAISVLASREIDVREMVDGDFPLAQAAEALALAQKPETIKVLITP
jgi:threonine dehydrogenase-like Zn-dependent dehydrogenase